jgi:hypothetical protein
MIDRMIKAIHSTAAAAGSQPSEVYIHIGGVEIIRRAFQRELAYDVVPNSIAMVLGLRIYESEHIKPGFFLMGGKLYRYTKPTIDEMCQEALQRLSAVLDADVRRHLAEMFR